MTRKSLTILLISLALCGVQVVQASPIHDHVSHFAGCSLCHFDGAHALQSPDAGAALAPQAAIHRAVAITAAPFTAAFPDFLGRAPPRISP